ncbi:hypothetical protein CVIRNUC_002199 [Coccomyxa viridis]|uniref:Uncharacterized protein n=1 Tax=Coccomyxa viridis TaxID=1274662 RepID=A0AAV1HW72_9CHLO|nr:hypothetical protein CVIRNUC_002199 [Coccomyxa viridis]
MRMSSSLAARNLFEVARRLQKDGLGQNLQRTSWPDDSFWTITAIKPSLDGKHGDASGIFTWKGTQQHALPRRVRGVLKRVWKTVPAEGAQNWVTKKKPSLGKPMVAAGAEASAQSGGEGS